MREDDDRVRIGNFGDQGLRIAYRDGTADKWAVRPWLEWAGQEHPIPEGSGSGEAILDVGAHIGGFTLLAARMAPSRRVIALEPSRDSYEILVRNVKLNELRNVETARLAIAGHSGEARLFHHPGSNTGHTIVKTLSEGGEQVETRTLTDFLHEKDVDRCAIAKFNCEGAEFPILMTAPTETLRSIRQMIILYHLDLVEKSTYNLGELEHRLEDAGFELDRYEMSATRGHISARLSSQSH